MQQADKIRQFIVKNTPKNPNDLVAMTAIHFSVSRTTVLRHIKILIDAGVLIKTGTTKQVTYMLPKSTQQQHSFSLNGSFDEFDIFNQYISPVIKKHINNNCFDICEYCITEILNNAKDHSRGNNVKLSFKINKDDISFSCEDNGIGVFKNIQQHLNFPDTRTTMLQLSKGKLTTDASNHSGEGIFFSCRAIDDFSLFANNFCFLRCNIENDWSFYETDHSKGTKVDLIINKNTNRSLQQVFARYQDDDSLQFSKTEVIIELAKEHGQRLISRSQAKRVITNLEKFKQATFDFKGVKIVGQGFVDQLFRVFQQQHPHIKLNYINANDDVTFMIQRSV